MKKIKKEQGAGKNKNRGMHTKSGEKHGFRGSRVGIRDRLSHDDCKYIDWAGTLRIASITNGNRGCGEVIKISPEDIKIKKYKGKAKNNIIFLLDTSRSQGSEKRLSVAKGLIMYMLSGAYVNRDKVALITFGDKEARLLIPLTKSPGLAKEQLEKLQAKGNTPLAQGLRRTLEYVRTCGKKEQEGTYIMVLLTDGKGNYDAENPNPMEAVKEAVGMFEKAEIGNLVIDTDKKFFNMGMALELSKQLRSEYEKL